MEKMEIIQSQLLKILNRSKQTVLLTLLSFLCLTFVECNRNIVRNTNGSNKNELSITGKLVDYVIPGPCGRFVYSGIFMFYVDKHEDLNIEKDSVFVIIACPSEDYFTIGKKYVINGTIDKPKDITEIEVSTYQKYDFLRIYTYMNKISKIEEVEQ